MSRDLLDKSLSPADRAGLCEFEAAELLAIPDPTPLALQRAQAYATLGQSLRLRRCEEWLGSIRDDGVGVG